MPKIKYQKQSSLSHFPFDENDITSLLFLEESWSKRKSDSVILRKLISMYAVN